MGVTELEHFFPNLNLTIIDFLPQCLGPLPARAAAYCARYMNKHGIKQHYSTKYDATSDEFWAKIGLPNKVDKEYVCIGVKASNYFMPKETLSEKGPGGGGWILMDMTLAVMDRDNNVWSLDDKGHARIYAVGDCNAGGVPGEKGGKPDEWPIPPIPKISYPGEEQAVIAVKNVEKIDRLVYKNETHDLFGTPLEVHAMHWP